MTRPAPALDRLEEVLEAMLLANEEITARGVVRRLDGLLRHASDITRMPVRRALMERFQCRQAELRAVMEKADKQSRTNLAARLARKEEEAAELKRQRDILIASHKAMLLVVGEMGGMAGWRRFFERHQAVLEELNASGALPAVEIQPLARAAERGPSPEAD